MFTSDFIHQPSEPQSPNSCSITPMKTRIVMNQIKQLAVSVATACSLFYCVEVHASPVERKLIEQAMKMAGREALEKGAKG